MLKKLIGIIIYNVLRQFSLVFVCNNGFSKFIENFRTQALVWQGMQIKEGSVIRRGVFILKPNNLKIGKNVTIGFDSRFYNYSKVQIGDDTELGPNLHIQTNDHLWADLDLPLGKQGTFSVSVNIGKGVYIGANVTILQGVCISDRCIIAAGSVVVKDTQTGYLYGGVPARKIKPLRIKT